MPGEALPRGSLSIDYIGTTSEAAGMGLQAGLQQLQRKVLAGSRNVWVLGQVILGGDEFSMDLFLCTDPVCR